MKVRLMVAGYCTQSEHLAIQGGGRRTIKFPALFALLEHPTDGPILFDTGYTHRFFAENNSFPYSLYRRTTPVFIDDDQTAAAQLKRLGIQPDEVRTIILSHFHADHVAGVQDFPRARFIYLPQAYEAVRGRHGLSALLAAYLPGLLPPDFEARSLPAAEAVPLPECFRPFTRGYDLLGDGSILGIEVSGHAAGQMGIVVQSGGTTYFLCADAAWSSRAYRENRPPHWLAGLIMPDPRAYRENFNALVELHRRQPEIRIIPSHCEEVWDER